MNDKSEKQKRLKELLRSALPLLILAAAVVILTLLLLPEIRRLATPEGRESFKQYIDNLGVGGWFVTLGIQLLQIFIALIPGEPVELMLGYVWGPWLGTFTCLLGIFIGTCVIYLLVKRLGRAFVRRVVGDGDMTKYKFLRDPRKIDITLFILFFIPGTPKDALSYIAPLAPIKPMKYILIATFARIPSIVTSTVLGDRIAEGDYSVAIIVFVLTAIISVTGIIVGNKFTKQKQDEDDGKKGLSH